MTDAGRRGLDGGGFVPSDPVRSFLGTVRGVVSDPRGFFGRLDPREDPKNPPLFAALCAWSGAALALAFGVVVALAAGNPPLAAILGDSTWPSLFAWAEGRGTLVGAAAVALAVALAPVGTLLSLLVLACAAHLIMPAFSGGGPRAGFGTTLRVVLYVGGVLELVRWVPVVGFLAALWAIYAAMVGLRAAHGAGGISGARARA